MKNKVIVGLQWGDEGKGKIIDALAKEADFAVRFNGGNNAGHTVIVDGVKHVFHCVPSAILYPNCVSIISSGTVLDLEGLYKELSTLRDKGIKLNLKISPFAHVISPEHKQRDAQQEAGTQAIGTTKRGIGPCYADKALRTGIRIIDLYQDSTAKNRLVEAGMDSKLLADIIEFLKPLVKDTQAILQQAIRDEKFILFEGAQGLMLDVDYGTYPYVTSSTTHPANAAVSNGIPCSALGEVMGVTKAYTTRVGKGPFPTELDTEAGERLRKAGNEFGATTGRPRRCGWLDLPQLKYAVKMAGVQKVIMTKLDILAEMPEVKVCVNYKNKGSEMSGFSWDNSNPEYKTFDALPKLNWSKIKSWTELPTQIKEYIHFVEKEIAAPIEYVSFGPQRDSLIQTR